MASGVHRDGDSRSCGASTIVTGQNNVYINGQLASVLGDPNSHGSGDLLADVGSGTFYINGKLVVMLGSGASPDALCPIIGPPHCNPSATAASGDVFGG